MLKEWKVNVSNKNCTNGHYKTKGMEKGQYIRWCEDLCRKKGWSLSMGYGHAKEIECCKENCPFIVKDDKCCPVDMNILLNSNLGK